MASHIILRESYSYQDEEVFTPIQILKSSKNDLL